MLYSVGKKLNLLGLILLLLELVGNGDARADWREEWDKTLQAAKKEGRVVIYSYPGLEHFFLEFQKKYPEIRFVEVSVRGSSRIQRIMAERRAGRYLADVVIGGAGSGYIGLYKTKVLDPIKPTLMLPEVVDESKWWGGKHIYADDEKEHILAFGGAPSYYFHYNTKLVNPAEFKSYWDFLKPKWKGKMVVKTPMTGGTPEILRFLYYNPELGPNFLRRFLNEMDLTATRDIRQFVDWLANGKFAIAGLQNASRIRLGEAKKQGLPIDTFDFAKFKEGISVGSGGGNLFLINHAPHPNAAKVFINWVLSRKGQMAWQKLVQGGRNSLRIDIPKDDVPPEFLIPKGIKYTVQGDPRYRDLETVRRFINKVWKRK